MKIDLKHAIGTGLSIAGMFVPEIASAEKWARLIPGLRGKAKQDAVLELVKNALAAAEDVTGKDLLDDADVEQAARGVIDAIVGFHNVVEKKKAEKAAKAA